MKMEEKRRAGTQAAQEKFAVRQCSEEELPGQMGRAFGVWARARLKEEPFVLVGLSGGRSLEGLFENARNKLPKAMWRRIFFFPVDERIVPPASRENNARLLREKTLRPLLARHDIKGANVLALDTKKMMKQRNEISELSSYSHALQTLRPQGADLLILGIGRDGHVASLFPNGREVGARGRGWLLVKNSPKPPKKRATVAPDEMRLAKELWLVGRGEEKRQALEKLLAAAGSVKNCPARLARENKNGAILWTDLQ